MLLVSILGKVSSKRVRPLLPRVLLIMEAMHFFKVSLFVSTMLYDILDLELQKKASLTFEKKDGQGREVLPEKLS